jgi:hypothetical protein
MKKKRESEPAGKRREGEVEKERDKSMRKK